ncbi:MAG: indolepyruvate oxidoreductase subunit beta [Deltaproteobacteria bacterium]|nr:indolepyruvate oxidoreductase subunit beta [Deltaproteobacteria bacterium]
MKQDIILAGVGGQGILTIAEVISQVALSQGLQVKQAETHGMSQRGGAVQSHLRLSDAPIFSDLIPLGSADLVIAVEPLEALRYVQYLKPDAMLLTSVGAFVNIGNYPPVEDVLAQVAQWPHHALIDADRLARAAGSGRAANMVVLGAASRFLKLDQAALEQAMAERFAAKGERVVEVNRRAFRFGRTAAAAYLLGLDKGGTSVSVRTWVDSLTTEHLAQPEPPDAPYFEPLASGEQLSGAEIAAVESTLQNVYDEGRKTLFEHEVYQIIQLVGAISPPKHIFVPKDELLSDQALDSFPGEKVVCKLVATDVVHKTDAKAVVFAPKRSDLVRGEIDRLMQRHADKDVRGVLVVEFVEHTHQVGSELFVGIRATREFGPVIAAGLGGVDMELLATRMRPGQAVAKSPAADLKAEEFLEQFKRTVAYELLSGQARGHERSVSDGELLRCFRAFLLLAQRFCVDRGADGPDLAELEINPFAFRGQRLVPLDGRARTAPAARTSAPRPVANIAALLEPASIAVLGASATSMNFGRIILNNVLQAGYDPQHLFAIKDGLRELDGARCVASLAELPHTVDLLVVAAGAEQLPKIVSDTIACGKVRSAILVPGGAGETEGSAELAIAVQKAIAQGRAGRDDGPVFLGPNSLGVLSRPGHYDTLFIPANRLNKHLDQPARRVALISQSGAFIVSRMSNLDNLNPAFALSIGNQLDLTLADLTAAVGQRDDIDVVGVYCEGFRDLDGLAFARALREVTRRGKEVIFYKAGRTQAGRTAAAGHTASVAGDYDVALAAAEQAGAIVVETFKEFEQLLELCAALHGKSVSGTRLGVMSNAGFETVGMADALVGPRYRLELAQTGQGTVDDLRAILAKGGLANLVNPRNPLDLTPMASESVYQAAAQTLLDASEVDALVVGIVPLTAALQTGAEEVGNATALPQRLGALFAAAHKPVVAVVDSGEAYLPLVQQLRSSGMPVFRSADQAVRSLGRYLTYRANWQG